MSEIDRAWLASLQWVGRSGRGRWYVRYYGDRQAKFLSREIAKRMGLQVDGMQVDHINRNVNDNRRSNLRLATNGENRANSACRNKIGFKGVKKRPNSDRWVAQITVNGKKKHLGTFQTPQEAHLAYCLASKHVHKEFHCSECR